MGRRRAHSNRTAGRRELSRVGQQVEQDLAQFQLVGPDRWHALVEIDRYGEIFCIDLLRHHA